MKSVSAFTQNDQRLAEIRAGFVLQGSSFHAWCTQNGIDTHNARKAVTGKWKGPKATALILQLSEAARVCAK